MRAVIVVLGLAAACGETAGDGDGGYLDLDLAAELGPEAAPADVTAGDGAGGDGSLCGRPIGAGTLAGTVDGQALVATRAAGVKAHIGGITAHYVGFFAQGGACSAFYPEGPVSVLYVTLCDVTPGTYAVGSTCAGRDGGLTVSNEVKIPRPGADARATSGTITIDAFAAGACGGAVKGRLDVSFSGEEVTGTFDTVSCGTVYPQR